MKDYAAVAMAVKRFEKRFPGEKVLHEQFNRICHLLNVER